jgi:DNA gyrase subunit A
MDEGTILLATDRGDVKRIRVADLPGLTANAFTVMNCGYDRVIGAHYVNDDDEVILVTSEGQAIRFKVNEVRPTGLPAGGMRGIKLPDTDRAVSISLPRYGTEVWVITEAGLAKSTALPDYPLQGRAGTGVVTMKLTPGDRIAAATIATVNDLVVVLTQRGKFKVVKFKSAPAGPRSAKGDFVVSMSKSDRVRAITQIVQRPVPPPVFSAEPSTNGTSHQEGDAPES